MARELVVDGPVFDPRPDPGARRVAYVSNNACASPSSTAAAGSWPATRIPTSPGERRLHRRRGDWAVTGATGGAPTAEPWRPAVSMCHRSRGGTSPTRRIPTSSPARSAIRRPAPPTPTSTCTCLALDGGSIEVAWDHDRFPYLAAVHWVSPERLLLMSSRATSATWRCWKPIRPPATPRRLHRPRRPLGRARARHARPARRRAVGDGRRPRRRPSPDGRR